ncbi:hypothetical protein GVN20_24065 [Runella sp. CRIBMP]|uniref:hypothetical protein n=1 Tax=Runella sp. CRIBMP TaxID=2683261 RepID=UPI00141376AF|nr:hypothetical protein [Runella sp. CRIBMP]NBB22451.1 hypothetical protein [Runella sp. CRIBMP]
MFEHHSQKVLPRPKFQRRVLKYSLVALGMIGVSWIIGAAGYHYLTHPHLSWVDSFYNAAMILGGMGPVDPLKCDTAKIFASFYALFSGITFLSATSVLFAPFIHRFFHILHVDNADR